MAHKLMLIGLGLAGLLAFAGCAAAPAAAGPATTTVHVVASEWALTPNHASIPAGTVTFELENKGRATHELVVIKTDLPTKGLPASAGNPALVDEAAAGNSLGEVEDVGAGVTKTETMDLAPGRYLLICNEVGHYKAGMVTEFTVTA